MGQQNYAVVATVLEELGEAKDEGIEGYLNSKLPVLKSDPDGDTRWLAWASAGIRRMPVLRNYGRLA